MRRQTILTGLGLLAAVLASTMGEAGDWPRWRGPLANGTAPGAKPPIHWSESENLRFKVRLPGRGLASPIVYGDRLFLLAAVAADDAAYAASQEAAAEKLRNRQWPPSVSPVRQRFVVLALDAATGATIWQRTAAEKVPHESHYIDSSWASASPVTDGEVLLAQFGSNGLYAYDLDGQLLWQADLGKMRTRNGFGEGSSPAIHGDLVVVNWDHEGDSFIVALDKKTGEERWRTPRPGEVTSWSTPLIVASGGRFQVVVAATGKSRGYDLRTGEEIWRLGGMTVNTIPTPVAKDGVVYLTSGYRGQIFQAVDLAKAQGDLEGTDAVRFVYQHHTPYVPSPVLMGERIYFLKQFKNILTVLDANTGAVVYTEVRLPGIDNVYASPVGAAGRVYFLSRDGHAVVLRDGPSFEVLAENDLDDGFDASPAIAHDTLYLRGRHHLYAIANTRSQEPAPATGTKARRCIGDGDPAAGVRRIEATGECLEAKAAS